MFYSNSKPVVLGLAVFLVASFLLSGQAYAAAPSVRTLSADMLSANVATLNGTLNPRGERTTYWFEYGRDFDLDQETSKQSVGDYDAQIDVSNTIYGGL